jgi:hypothetical protein
VIGKRKQAERDQGIQIKVGHVSNPKKPFDPAGV